MEKFTSIEEKLDLLIEILMNHLGISSEEEMQPVYINKQ